MTVFYCVRHGESTYNVEGRLQGQSDRPGLSELGRRQSEAAAEALAAYPIEAVFASPLKRARETAEIIGRRLDLAVRFDPRLKEIDVGLFQDQARADLERTYAAELARWQSGEPGYALPGGESRSELARRGIEAFRAIAETGLGHVAVVSHGGLLVTTIKSLLGVPFDQPPLALENASITRFCWLGIGPIEVLGLDEIGHLRGLESGAGDLAV